MNSNYLKTNKDLLLRTRGRTWEVIEPRDEKFTRVSVFGGHRKFYVKIEDLDRSIDRIPLYERIYDLPPLMYIAGPYTHQEESGILANINRARRASLDCCKVGWAVHCPHANYSGFHSVKEIPYETWIRYDLSVLAKCDAILLLDGWASSKGASQEFAFADEHGIPQFFAKDGIPKPDAIRGLSHA